jgi:hypothetical protein
MLLHFIDPFPPLAGDALITAESLMKQTLGYNKPQLNATFGNRQKTETLQGMHKFTVQSYADAEKLQKVFENTFTKHKFPICDNVLVRWM